MMKKLEEHLDILHYQSSRVVDPFLIYTRVYTP
jgi:hypothetical protein